MKTRIKRTALVALIGITIVTIAGAQEAQGSDDGATAPASPQTDGAPGEGQEIITEWDSVNTLERPEYGNGAVAAPETKRRLQVSTQARLNFIPSLFIAESDGQWGKESHPAVSAGFLARVDRFYASAVTLGEEYADDVDESDLGGAGWESDDFGNVETSVPQTWIVGFGAYQDLIQTGRTAIIAAYGGAALALPEDEYGMGVDVGLSLGLEMNGGFGRLRNLGWAVNLGVTQFFLGEWGGYAQTADGTRTEQGYANNLPLIELGYSIMFRPVMGDSVDSFGQMRSDAIWHWGRRDRVGGEE